MGRRKTSKEYYNECINKGYDIPLENYINAQTKIKHKCDKGHIYLQAPHEHLKGKGCSICKGTFKKTPKEYYEECKEKGLDLPIEDYINNKTKIKHECDKGHIYEQTPHMHLNGIGCPMCKGTPKKTPKEYYEECKAKGYDLPIEDYINNKIKIKHKCKYGHIYLQIPKHHLSGTGCPICNGNIKKTSKEYYEECKEKGLDLPIEDYVNNSTKIKHKCKKGHIYEQTPHMHLIGQGCPICNGNVKKTPKEYYEECKYKGYDLPIENYRNATTKIKHKCNKCGYIWKTKPAIILSGCSCPICNQSHGEKFIENYLNFNNIKYIPQKTFDDLVDTTYLSYDFYLPDYNILIEYQGKQHYQPVRHFGGEETYKTQLLHDNLKREYAKEHNYKLLELHYTLDTQDKVNNYLKRRIKWF